MIHSANTRCAYDLRAILEIRQIPGKLAFRNVHLEGMGRFKASLPKFRWPPEGVFFVALKRFRAFRSFCLLFRCFLC